MDTNLEQVRKRNFEEAMGQTYAGCLFDIDGTLTVWGEEVVPAYLQQPLADISMKVPMGVCTGRRLHHALEAIEPIFMKAANPTYCQSNWLLFCDSGGIGYRFDAEKKEYVELYRIEQPYNTARREMIFYQLKKAVGKKASRCDINEISMAFVPYYTFDMGAARIMEQSRRVREIIEEQLPLVDPKGALRVADAGNGVNVFPLNGDKENGTMAFANYLRSFRGYVIGEDIKEIAVIGDQPIPKGNDEVFLNGKFGTPFTVGKPHPENVIPLPVFDNEGKNLEGPEAVAALISRMKFRTDG